MTMIQSANGIRVHASAGELQLAMLVRRRLQFESHVGLPIEGTGPHALTCTPDLLFRRGQVAVFYDGCYWHECPEHSPDVRQGEARRLDGRNNQALVAMGWNVLRIWEHEDVADSAQRVVDFVRECRRSSSPARIRAFEPPAGTKSPKDSRQTTPTRPIRVPLDLWEAFGEAVQKIGVKDRSAYLRDVMRWVIHDTSEPKPKAPKRPAEPTPRKPREDQ